MKTVYFEVWVQELCERGYLRSVKVPDEVDHTAPDFDPYKYEQTDYEGFLGANDLDLDDPENHPARVEVHGTDLDESYLASEKGAWR